MTLLIIIPTFQRPQLLRSCLNSISTQSNLNVRVLVVDQSFDDESQIVCNQFPGIHYIHADYQNKSKAINDSIVGSDEDIISIIDDDTVLDKNWVAVVFQSFCEPSINIVQGSIFVSDNSTGDAVDNNQDVLTKKQIIGRSHIPPLFRIGCNFAFRRHVINRTGFFNESLGPGTKIKAGEDLEWGYRVFKHGFKLLLNPEMCISHTSWRGKDDLQRQTEDYGRSFGKVLKIIRKSSVWDFGAYSFYYLIWGHMKSIIRGTRTEWYNAAWKGLFEL